MMRALSRSLGRFDITVNSVAIAATRTPAIERLVANEEIARKVLKSYIIRRSASRATSPPWSRSSPRRAIVAGTLGWLLGCPAAPVTQSDAPAASGEESRARAIEEIVVTALRREESIQQVPISTERARRNPGVR